MVIRLCVLAGSVLIGIELSNYTPLHSSPTFGEGAVGILCCLPIVMESGRVALYIPAQAFRGYGRTIIVPGVPHAPSQTCGRVGALGFDRALGCGMLCGVGSVTSTSNYALSIG